MSTLETFMGSTVLNAVAEGNTIQTPNTPDEEDSEEAFIFSDLA